MTAHAMAIIVELKPTGEFEIEKAKAGCSDGVDLHKIRVSRSTGGITEWNYTCPYCFQPFNKPEDARKCRDACFKRKNEKADLLNMHFKYPVPGSDQRIIGRIVSFPDEFSALTVVAKPTDPAFLGPAQLLVETIKEHMLPV